MLTQSTVLDFKGQNIFVGIDVHLKSWTVTILTGVDRSYPIQITNIKYQITKRILLFGFCYLDSILFSGLSRRRRPIYARNNRNTKH